jgi:TonB family protein
LRTDPRSSAVALSLILSLFCLLPARTTFASHNLRCAQRAEDHSPAFKEGMDALRKNDNEKAAEHFKQAAADKPDDMWAFYYFGLCLLKLERVDEAAKAYQQALAIKPETSAIHYQLGKIYLKMGDLEAAEKEYSWLHEHDRELANLLFPVRAFEPLTADLRPTITYREKAKYTEIARINIVQGTVVLQVVFAHNGEMQDIRVIRSLPDGLTEKAIEAARKIKFDPAIKDGERVSVRGQL